MILHERDLDSFKNTKKVKYSIIITVYNTNPVFLERCLLSIINQNFPKNDYEILIADDGSTLPDTLALLKTAHEKFPDLITLIYLSKNYGTPSVGRNKCLDIASGEYILMGDSDDYFSVYTLQIVNSIISFSTAKDEILDLIVTDYYDKINFDIKITDIETHNKKIFDENGLTFNYRQPDIFPMHLFTVRQVLRREFLNMHNIRFNETLAYCEDMVFSTKVNIYLNKSGHISGPYLYYRELDPVDGGGAYSRHLGEQIKTPEYAATICAIEEIVSAEVNDNRKVWFLLNNWGAKSWKLSEKVLINYADKPKEKKSILGLANYILKQFPDNLTAMFPPLYIKIIEAIKRNDFDGWIEAERLSNK